MWFRLIVIWIGLIALWQGIVWVTQSPPYILPAPHLVLAALFEHFRLIMFHAMVTALEIMIGLALGCLLGLASALIIFQFRKVRPWLLPVLVASQALPVFAIAPVLMLWLGYGMASKVAMATLIIYFPVTAAAYDGLRNTEQGWVDLATIMGGTRMSTLRHIRLPAALPSLASGVRIAAAVAPIGAVVGEWVGSSTGLGYLMLHANARTQVDLMFAALVTLAVFAVMLYFSIDFALKKMVFWNPDNQ